MGDNPTLTLKEGVEATLLKHYGVTVLQLINHILWYGKYDYEEQDRGNQDHDDVVIQGEIADWDTPDPYCSYMVFYFDKDDFEVN